MADSLGGPRPLAGNAVGTIMYSWQVMIAFEAALTVDSPPLCAPSLLWCDAVGRAQSRMNDSCCMATCHWLLYCFPCMRCLIWMHAGIL